MRKPTLFCSLPGRKTEGGRRRFFLWLIFFFTLNKAAVCIFLLLRHFLLACAFEAGIDRSLAC